MLALRHVAWPVLLVAYPLFQWAGWGSGAWLLCAGMWSVQRLIQAGVNRFVLDLPPTPAVASEPRRNGGSRREPGLHG